MLPSIRALGLLQPWPVRPCGEASPSRLAETLAAQAGASRGAGDWTTPSSKPPQDRVAINAQLAETAGRTLLRTAQLVAFPVGNAMQRDARIAHTSRAR